MKHDTHVPPTDEDADDGDNGDSRAAYLRFANALTPATRAAFLAPPKPVRPAEPSEMQLLREAVERLTARLFPPEPSVPLPPPPVLPGLASAVEVAGLIGAERRVANKIAQSGRMSVSALELLIEGDVLSAVKRAKPKLRKHGWHVFRRDGHIDAKPIPRGRK